MTKVKLSLAAFVSYAWKLHACSEAHLSGPSLGHWWVPQLVFVTCSLLKSILWKMENSMRELKFMRHQKEKSFFCFSAVQLCAILIFDSLTLVVSSTDSYIHIHIVQAIGTGIVTCCLVWRDQGSMQINTRTSVQTLALLHFSRPDTERWYIARENVPLYIITKYLTKHLNDHLINYKKGDTPSWRERVQSDGLGQGLRPSSIS